MPSTAQPASETDEKKSRGLGSYVLWAFVAVMVYVLSSGPVAKLTYKLARTVPRDPKIPMTLKIVNFVYSPIGWAYNKTSLHKPIGLYFHIWLPETVDANGNVIEH